MKLGQHGRPLETDFTFTPCQCHSHIFLRFFGIYIYTRGDLVEFTVRVDSFKQEKACRLLESGYWIGLRRPLWLVIGF